MKNLLVISILFFCLSIYAQSNDNFKEFKLGDEKSLRSGIAISPDGKTIAIAGMQSFPLFIYDWENDKINIHTHTFANTTKTMEQAKVQCKNIFETIERVFLVKDGKDMLDDCQICHVFSHEGWGNSRLRTARNEIKNKFELIAHNFKHKCTKKLYGETVNVSEVKY